MTLSQMQQDYLEPLLKYQKKVCFEEEEEKESSNETEYSYLRLLPDMSEGLIGLSIGDIMGILISIDANKTLNIQQQQILKTFIETLLRTSKSSLSIFKLSILYLYKLNKKLKEPSILNIFKSKLDNNKISTMESISQAKLLFVVILMLAFKYTEDHCYYISAWSKATGIPSDTIHKLEVEILNILDHNLFVSQERFETFSSRIIQKINKLKIDLLQSVKISYASSNYFSSSEEENSKCDNNSLRCKKCTCNKRKQESTVKGISKKRKQESTLIESSKKKKINAVSLSINTKDTKDTSINEQQADNASTFYTLPTTLYDYYRNRHGGVLLNKQPLTPPTPNPYTKNTSSSKPKSISNNTINNTIGQNKPSIKANLLQVDSMIIPSTPPTSQTSIYEDMEREEEIKNSEEENDEEDEELYEEDEADDEGESGNDEKIPKSLNTFKSSGMAFILNPDENKIQLDYGDNYNIHNIHSKAIPYHYTPSPSHHKTNFAYDNLKKINLLDMKNEKTRTTPSIVLPNTSPIADVASIFPSLSMISQQNSSTSNVNTPIEDTTNKNKSIGLKSLLSDEIFKSSIDSIIISNSNEKTVQTQPQIQNTVESSIKNNYITIRNDDNADTNNSNTNSVVSTTCPYINQIYTLSNEDITKQKLLLSIYNCYAMRNIRHYQI